MAAPLESVTCGQFAESSHSKNAQTGDLLARDAATEFGINSATAVPPTLDPFGVPVAPMRKIFLGTRG